MCFFYCLFVLLCLMLRHYFVQRTKHAFFLIPLNCVFVYSVCFCLHHVCLFSLCICLQCLFLFTPCVIIYSVFVYSVCFCLHHVCLFSLCICLQCLFLFTPCVIIYSVFVYSVCFCLHHVCLFSLCICLGIPITPRRLFSRTKTPRRKVRDSTSTLPKCPRCKKSKIRKVVDTKFPRYDHYAIRKVRDAKTPRYNKSHTRELPDCIEIENSVGCVEYKLERGKIQFLALRISLVQWIPFLMFFFLFEKIKSPACPILFKFSAEPCYGLIISPLYEWDL